MRKAETLRGRGAFSSVLKSGEKLDGQLLRCFFRVEEKAGTPVRAGFSVSSRVYNAAKRNRIRRLLRTAFDAEAEVLRDAAGLKTLALVFVFRGGRDEDVRRLRLKDVQTDVAALCRRCAARIVGSRT